MITQYVRHVASSDDSDLEFNRRGKLSPAQSAQFTNGAVGALILGSLLSLLGFLITMAAWASGAFLAGLVAGGPVIALGGFTATRPRPQAVHDVHKLEGVLERVEDVGLAESEPHWYLIVDGVEMTTSEARLIQNLEAGEAYTFFFTPIGTSRSLLSWERQS